MNQDNRNSRYWHPPAHITMNTAIFRVCAVCGAIRARICRNGSPIHTYTPQWNNNNSSNIRAARNFVSKVEKTRGTGPSRAIFHNDSRRRDLRMDLLALHLKGLKLKIVLSVCDVIVQPVFGASFASIRTETVKMINDYIGETVQRTKTDSRILSTWPTQSQKYFENFPPKIPIFDIRRHATPIHILSLVRSFGFSHPLTFNHVQFSYLIKTMN